MNAHRVGQKSERVKAQRWGQFAAINGGRSKAQYVMNEKRARIWWQHPMPILSIGLLG